MDEACTCAVRLTIFGLKTIYTYMPLNLSFGGVDELK
jgi:hypothetical protein